MGWLRQKVPAHVAAFERAWPDACKHAKLGQQIETQAGLFERGGNRWTLPEIWGAAPAGAGTWEWQLRPAKGGTVDMLSLAVEALEAELDVWRITPIRHERASKGTLLVHFADPFPTMIPWRVPEEWSLDVPLGRRADGKSFGVRLGHGPHILAGGTTDSGKSTFSRALLASACCLEGVELWLVDPKMVELTPFAGRASDVACELDECVDLIDRAVAALDRRKRILSAAGVTNADELCAQRKVAWCEDMPWVVLVLDELAPLMRIPAVRDQLYVLAQQARAFGIQIVSMTQSPGVDILPTPFRINHGLRWAGSCSTMDEAGVLLGGRELAKRAPAHELPIRTGEAYWRRGRDIIHVKSCYLDATAIPQIVKATLTEKPPPSLPGVEGVMASRAPVPPEPAPAPAPAPGREREGLASSSSVITRVAEPSVITIPPQPRWPRVVAPAGFPTPDRKGRALTHRIAAWRTEGERPECRMCAAVLDWSADGTRVAAIDPAAVADLRRPDPSQLVVLCKACMGAARSAGR